MLLEEFVEFARTRLDVQTTCLKLCEELSELQTILLQMINKPNKVDVSNVYEEIADVRIMLERFESYLEGNERQDINRFIAIKTDITERRIRDKEISD